jgi:hypothetical protein
VIGRQQDPALDLEQGGQRLCGDRGAEGEAALHQLVVGHHLAHEAVAQRLAGAHQATGEAQVARHRLGQPGQRGGVGRRDAARQLGEPEGRRQARDAHVAVQRQHEAARDRRPVHRRHRRLGEPRHGAEGRHAGVDQPLLVRAVAAELRHVHPGAERGSRSGQHRARHAVVGRQSAERLGQLHPQVDRERVALLGAAQRDQRHRGVHVHGQQVAHGLAQRVCASSALRRSMTSTGSGSTPRRTAM